MSPKLCPWCGKHNIDHSEDYEYYNEEMGCTVSFEEYTCHDCGNTFTV